MSARFLGKCTTSGGGTGKFFALQPTSLASHPIVGGGAIALVQYTGTINVYYPASPPGISGDSYPTTLDYVVCGQDPNGVWMAKRIKCKCVVITHISNLCSGANKTGTLVAYTGSTTLSFTLSSTTSNSISLPFAGVWNLTYSATGYTTQTFTLTLACGTQNYTALLRSSAPTTISGSVQWSCLQSGPYDYSGWSIEVDDHTGFSVGTATTDSTGAFSVTLPEPVPAPVGGVAPVYTVTSRKGRWANYSWTVSVICGQNNSVIGTTSADQVAATGFHCGGCGDPDKDTLILTDPSGFNTTCTYQTQFGYTGWVGCRTYGGGATPIVAYYRVGVNSVSWYTNIYSSGGRFAPYTCPTTQSQFDAMAAQTHGFVNLTTSCGTVHSGSGSKSTGDNFLIGAFGSRSSYAFSVSE